MDNLLYGAQVMLLGLVIVFVGLIVLIAAIKILSLILKCVGQKEASAPAQAAPAAPAAPAAVQAAPAQEVTGNDKLALVAVLTATALASEGQKEGTRLVVRSVRKLIA